MNIAIVNNGQVVQMGDYRSLFPQTSFPVSGPSSDFFAQNSALPVNSWKPHDAETQKLSPCTPYIDGGSVFTVEVLPLSAEDIAARNESLAASVRQERNRRLAESDWTQTVDSQVDKPAWQAYRQALRDVPTQTGFPTNVVWPESPAQL